MWHVSFIMILCMPELKAGNGGVGACLANPMAWIGSCVPLAIAFYWTHRSFKKKYHLA